MLDASMLRSKKKFPEHMLMCGTLNYSFKVPVQNLIRSIVQRLAGMLLIMSRFGLIWKAVYSTLYL